jgi:hypothetical protein
MSNVKVLPPTSDPRWRDVVTGKKKVPFDLLPLRMLMIGIRYSTRTDPSDKNVDECVMEVYNFFEANSMSAQKDIGNIFG